MSHTDDLPMSHSQGSSMPEVRPPRNGEDLKEVNKQPTRIVTTLPSLVVDHVSSVNSGSFDLSRRSDVSPISPSIASIDTSLKNQAVTGGNVKPRKIYKHRLSLTLGAVGLVLVCVAIGVPVGILKGRNSKTGLGANQSTSPPNRNSTIDFVPGAAPVNISNSSKVASVAWNDAEGIAQHRVYFQDNSNLIREKAWNSSEKLWTIGHTLNQAKQGSPIAAAVMNSPNQGFKLSVYAVSENGTVIDWNSNDSILFRPGSMTHQEVTPGSNCKITATWDRHLECPQCVDTLLFAYQRDDGHIEIGNFTEIGWDWTEIIESNSLPGTDLAFAPHGQAGPSDGVHLCYQLFNGALVYQSYDPMHGDPHRSPWHAEGPRFIAHFDPHSSLASFSSGQTTPPDSSKDSDHTDTVLNGIISVDSNGIVVSSCDGTGWSHRMAVQKPANVTIANPSALATNVDNMIYVVIPAVAGKDYNDSSGRIAIKEFKMVQDGISWMFMTDIAVT